MAIAFVVTHLQEQKKKQSNEITTFKEVIDITIILGLECYVSPPNRYCKNPCTSLKEFYCRKTQMPL